MKSKKSSIEFPLNTSLESPELIVEDLRSENRLLKKENRKLLRALAIYSQTIEQIKYKIKHRQNPKQITPIPINTGPSSNISACLLLGDWHIGEVVRPEEIGGINTYNLKIAKKRIDNILATFIRYITNQKNIYKIPDCHIIGLGDYISGNILKELEKHCELTLPQQITEAAFLLTKVINSLKPHFNTIYFYSISADNHGRLEEKTEFKQSAFSNLNYCILTLTKALTNLSDAQFKILPGIVNRIKINGVPMLVTHGHTVRGGQSFPSYGLNRLRLRELTKASKNKKHFKYIIMGHFHRPVILEDVIVNGSLVGPSEYAYATGDVSETTQIAFLLHPKWGAFNFIHLFGK